MDGIRQWAFGLCAAATACGVAQMVLPKSNLQKMFRMTASIFFLCCLLSPVALAPISLDSAPREDLQRQTEQRAQQLRSAVEEQSGRIATEHIRLTAAEILETLGVEYEKIYITIHEDDTDSISISECEVELDSRYLPRHQEIRAALQQSLGVDVLLAYKKE
ncbi:MAG: hypothetical protein HFG20_04115 [Anaerotruncus sp.]|nr:hypothetical protein [Anaerotruncus sp.]